jgi:hypothetical protein
MRVIQTQYHIKYNAIKKVCVCACVQSCHARPRHLSIVATVSLTQNFAYAVFLRDVTCAVGKELLSLDTFTVT